MKVFVFMLFVAVAVAFPSGESEYMPHPEMQPELKGEQNDLLAVEGNPKGDNTETERAKRTVFVGAWPFAYSYPYAYAYPFVRTKVIVG